MSTGKDSTLLSIKKSWFTWKNLLIWLPLFGFTNLVVFWAWLRGPLFAFLFSTGIEAGARPMVKQEIKAYDSSLVNARSAILNKIHVELDTLHDRTYLMQKVICRRYPAECREAMREMRQWRPRR